MDFSCVALPNKGPENIDWDCICGWSLLDQQFARKVISVRHENKIDIVFQGIFLLKNSQTLINSFQYNTIYEIDSMRKRLNLKVCQRHCFFLIVHVWIQRCERPRDDSAIGAQTRIDRQKWGFVTEKVGPTIKNILVHAAQDKNIVVRTM